jgi:hypothetical protein
MDQSIAVLLRLPRLRRDGGTVAHVFSSSVAFALSVSAPRPFPFVALYRRSQLQGTAPLSRK